MREFSFSQIWIADLPPDCSIEGPFQLALRPIATQQVAAAQAGYRCDPLGSRCRRLFVPQVRRLLLVWAIPEIPGSDAMGWVGIVDAAGRPELVEVRPEYDLTVMNVLYATSGIAQSR
jgi:hypothetical protein